MLRFAAVVTFALSYVLWLIASFGGPLRWGDDPYDDFDDPDSWGV